MSAIVYLSKKVATTIHNANPVETSSIERLTALLALQVVNVGVIAATLLVGLLTESVVETLLSVVTFVVMRLLTGGFHFRSLDVCFLVSTTVLAVIPHVELNMDAIYSISVVSILLIVIFSSKKIVIPVGIIILNIFLVSPIIALAILFQTLTLMRLRR